MRTASRNARLYTTARPAGKAVQSAWVAENDPTISKGRFCGTGTRFLSDDGRAAIRALFERSFGGR